MLLGLHDIAYVWELPFCGFVLCNPCVQSKMSYGTIHASFGSFGDVKSKVLASRGQHPTSVLQNDNQNSKYHCHDASCFEMTNFLFFSPVARLVFVALLSKTSSFGMLFSDTVAAFQTCTYHDLVVHLSPTRKLLAVNFAFL